MAKTRRSSTAADAPDWQSILPTEPTEASDDINDYPILLHGEKKWGKLQAMDALILTPTGYVEMRDVKVGRKVIGQNGKPTTVTGVFPQGVRQLYKVRFSDDTFAEAGADHLWFTSSYHERRDGCKGSIKTTEQIAGTIIERPCVYNHHVPWVAPVTFERQGGNLPLDPYALGVILGDGCISEHSIIVSNPEEDVVQSLRDTIPVMDKMNLVHQDSKKCPSYRIVSDDRSVSQTMQAIRKLGLQDCRSNAKFIPTEYLMASPDRRLWLLRGLLDTDGHVGKFSRIEYSTCSEKLAEGVAWLVRSLGGWCRIVSRMGRYTKGGETFHTQENFRVGIRFYNGIVPVSSVKHLGKWVETKRRLGRVIVGVEKSRRTECQCIQVDAADGLYVTNDFIVTHNTTVANEVGGVLNLTFDPVRKSLKIMQRHMNSWKTFMKYLKALEEAAAAGKFPYKRIVIDGADVWYGLCERWCEKELVVDSLADEKWGKGWSKLKKEFTAAVIRVLALPCGTWFICHSAEKEITLHDGSKIEKLVPLMSARGEEILNGRVEAWFACTYVRGEHVMVIKGSETVGAGCGIRGHFLTPDGRMVKEVPMGANETEAYQNLVNAFNNLQPYVSLKQRDKMLAEEGAAPAKKPKRK